MIEWTIKNNLNLQSFYLREKKCWPRRMTTKDLPTMSFSVSVACRRNLTKILKNYQNYCLSCTRKGQSHISIAIMIASIMTSQPCHTWSTLELGRKNSRENLRKIFANIYIRIFAKIYFRIFTKIANENAKISFSQENQILTKTFAQSFAAKSPKIAILVKV